MFNTQTATSLFTVSKCHGLFLLLLILPPNHRLDEFYDGDGGFVRSHSKSLRSLLFKNISRVKNTINVRVHTTRVGKNTLITQDA